PSNRSRHVALVLMDWLLNTFRRGGAPPTPDPRRGSPLPPPLPPPRPAPAAPPPPAPPPCAGRCAPRPRLRALLPPVSAVAAAAQVGLDRLRQPQQPQRVGDRRAVEAHALRELLLCPAELREQLLIRLGLLHRVEVLAEKVLDERDLETLRIGRLTHDGGNPR